MLSFLYGPGEPGRYPTLIWRYSIHMNYLPQALTTALHATPDLSADDNSVFQFADTRLRYELHIQPLNDTALLAIDPETPIQACPMLEYSFRCTDIVIGKSAYSVESDDVAIRFYEGSATQEGLRLAMTWIPTGYWYIWANANSLPFAQNVG